MNTVDQQYHTLMIVCIAVVVTVYLCMGLWYMREDTKLTRQLNITQINTPFFGYLMIFVILFFWPAKKELGALVWAVNEYSEKLE